MNPKKPTEIKNFFERSIVNELLSKLENLQDFNTFNLLMYYSDFTDKKRKKLECLLNTIQEQSYKKIENFDKKELQKINSKKR